MSKLRCLHCGKTATPSMEAMRKDMLRRIGYISAERAYEYPRGTFTREEMAALFEFVKRQRPDDKPDLPTPGESG